MSRRHSYTSVVQAAEKRKIAERQRLKHKIIYRWGILFFVGVFSFLYWFVFVPLVAPLLPANWFLIGPVAFIIWLIIIAPFLWLWHYKQKSLISLSPPPSSPKENVDCPSFPTQVMTVQPTSETKHNAASVAQESCVWVPVQPGNVTPSLYNAQTGRDSFQSGYQLDDSQEKSSTQGEKTISRNNSGVQLSKKFDTETKLMSSHRLISVSSSSSTELGGLDFKKIQRDPGDGLDAGEGDDLEGEVDDVNEEKLFDEEKEEPETENKEDQKVKLKRSEDESELKQQPGKEELVLSKTSDVVDFQPVSQVVAEINSEADPALLQREQSFKGLPEMQNFGEYLRLVTVDTPMSPRDAFFSDLSQSEPSKHSSEIHRHYRKSYHPGNELTDVQKRITDARKSLPPLFHYPDLEIGETRILKTTTLPQPAVLKLEDEQAPQKSYVRSMSEGRKHSWEVASRKPRSSGEYFVADGTRLDSVTSEVHVTINPGHGTTQLSRWETVVSGGRPSSGASSDKTDLDEPPVGRWVILSRDYASNNLEAFIRIEQEMMSKERSGPLLPGEDTDDSVFIEH